MNPEKRELLQAVLDEIKGLRQDIQASNHHCGCSHVTWTYPNTLTGGTYTQPNIISYM